MADKFPEIEGSMEDVSNESGDFLAREKELLGNEFSTEGDNEIVNGDEDEDFDDFKSQFPEVTESESQSQVEEPVFVKQHAPEANVNEISNKFDNLDINESEHYQEWKKTRELEISKRDEIAQRKLEDLQDEARKEIDDFYVNYNNKKEIAIEQTQKEAAAFLAKKEKFLENGTLWDRVVDLLKLNKNSDAVDAENFRDKSKFKDLLLALKGKENVPGASGI